MIFIPENIVLAPLNWARDLDHRWQRAVVALPCVVISFALLIIITPFLPLIIAYDLIWGE